MDNPVLQALKRYDSSRDMPKRRAVEPAPRDGDVIRTDFELFHGATTPIVKQEEPDLYQQGIVEGERRAAQLHSSVTRAMEESLAVLQTHFSQSLEDIKDEHASTLLAVFETALPALQRQSFFQDARDMIKRLSSSKLGGTILVNCAEGDAEALNQLFQSCSDPARFKITSTSNAPHQISFEWENGGADIDYKTAAEAALRRLTIQFETQNAAPQLRRLPQQNKRRTPL